MWTAVRQLSSHDGVYYDYEEHLNSKILLLIQIFYMALTNICDKATKLFKTFLSFKRVASHLAKIDVQYGQPQIFFRLGFVFFFLHCPLFREGCGGSSSRLSCHTSRSSITSIISLGRSPKRFHPRFSMQSIHLVLGRPTGLLPFALVCKACLGSLS